MNDVIIGTPHHTLTISTKEQATEAYGPPVWSYDGVPLNLTAAIHAHLDNVEPVVVVRVPEA